MKNIQNNNNKKQRKGKKSKEERKAPAEKIREPPKPRPFPDVAAWTSTLQLPIPAASPQIIAYAMQHGWPFRKSSASTDNLHAVAHLARMRALLVVASREGHGIKQLSGLNVYGTVRDTVVTTDGVDVDPNPRSDGTYQPGAFYHPLNSCVEFHLTPVGGPENQDHPGDLAREQGRVPWEDIDGEEFQFAVFVDVYHIETEEFVRVWARTWSMLPPNATVYFVFHAFIGALGCTVYEVEVPQQGDTVEKDGIKITKPGKTSTVRWTEGCWVREAPDKGGLICFRPDRQSSGYKPHPDVNCLLEGGCQDVGGLRCDLTSLDKIGPYSIVAVKRSFGELGGLRPLLGAPWEWVDATLLIPSCVPFFHRFNASPAEWWIRTHIMGPDVPERWLLVHRGVVSILASSYALKHSRGLTLQQLTNAVQLKLQGDAAWVALSTELASMKRANMASTASIHTAQAVFWCGKRDYLDAFVALQTANRDLDAKVKALRAEPAAEDENAIRTWLFAIPVAAYVVWRVRFLRRSPTAGPWGIIGAVAAGVVAEEACANCWPWFWTCNALLEASMSLTPYSHLLVCSVIAAARRRNKWFGLGVHLGWNMYCLSAQLSWAVNQSGYSVLQVNRPFSGAEWIASGYNWVQTTVASAVSTVADAVSGLVVGTCPPAAAHSGKLIVVAVLAAAALGWWFSRRNKKARYTGAEWTAFNEARLSTPSGVVGPALCLPAGSVQPSVIMTTSVLDTPAGLVVPSAVEPEAEMTLIGSGLSDDPDQPRPRMSALMGIPIVLKYVREMKQTPPVPGLYPFLIHDGLLHAPHPGVFSRVQALCNRVLADPYDGMSILEGMDEKQIEYANARAREAGHKAAFDIQVAALHIGAWLTDKQILGIFDQAEFQCGPEVWYGFKKEQNLIYETHEQAHRSMGTRGKRLAQAHAAAKAGKADKPMRSGQAKTDETIPMKQTATGEAWLKPRFLNSFDPTSLGNQSPASHAFSNALKVWWDGVRVWDNSGWLVCSACTVGWTSEILSEMHNLAMQRDNVITVWTQGDDQKFYVKPLMAEGYVSKPFGESDASSCDDTNRAQFVVLLTEPVKRYIKIGPEDIAGALQMHKRPIEVALDTVKGTQQAHIQKMVCQLPVKMSTGHGDTTPGNTLAIGGTFLGWLAQVRSFKGESNFEEYAWSMGLKLKVSWTDDESQVTFLKCWMVPGPVGGVNQPLPGLLVKLTKIASDPCVLFTGVPWERSSEEARRVCLGSAMRSMADGLPHVSRTAPLWRAFFKIADNLPLVVRRPIPRDGLIENYQFRVRGTRLCGEIDVEACFEMIEARYGLTKQDVLAMEKEIDGPLPIVCHHFGWARLAERDYC